MHRTYQGGDASTRFLASLQDAEMAALKDSTIFAPLPPGAASRGRDNYALLGVLRTKPGRADSLPTLSMSCSDKIASWNILGFQGALASRFLGPLYLSRIIIGEVPLNIQSSVREDCERALWRRLEGVNSTFFLHCRRTLPNPDRLASRIRPSYPHNPLHFTPILALSYCAGGH